MGMEQESEWNAAQSITISEDLVAAAKRQLQFLAAVDRNRWLYEGQTLQRAIYRLIIHYLMNTIQLLIFVHFLFVIPIHSFFALSTCYNRM